MVKLSKRAAGRMKRAVAWLERHTLVAMVCGFLSMTIAVGSVAYTYATHSAEVAKDQARDAAAQELRTPFCYLVYVYVNPAAGSPVNARSVQISQLWSGLGAYVGCPLGIKPPFLTDDEPAGVSPTPSASPSR